MSCPKLLRIHCHTLKSQYNLCLHCSFAYSHRNLFGRNQKLHVSLERGQIDSLFRINYSDPWISGDDMRTSRTIMVQVDLMFYVSSATFSYFSYYSKFLAEMFDQFFFQQNSRTPGTLIHGNQLDGSNLTIGRISAGIDFSRPIRPKWSGTAGLTYQVLMLLCGFFFWLV